MSKRSGPAARERATQKKMKHRIRIAVGISEGVIKFAETQMTLKEGKKIISIQGKTGGIGQGGGAGPLCWIAVIDVMLEAYRKLCPGATANDPMMLYTICYWLISYVDDNTIVVGFKDSTSTDEILATIRNNLGSWRRLLQLTGGDIDVVKSKWCVMKWTYSRVWGIPSIESATEFPGEVGMTSEANGQSTTELLERLEPHQAERVLGVRIPMDGNMKTELKAMEDFKAIDVEQDNAIELLKIVRTVAYQFESKKNIFLALLNAKLQVYGCKQQQQETVDDYKDRLEALIKGLEFYGGSISNDKSLC